MHVFDRTRRLAVLLGCLGCLAGPARARQALPEGVLPDSIVITASRTPEALRHTGRRVTVWTAADLRALPVASVDELLRTVAGVETFSRGGFGVQSDLTIRGSSFNGVLVLLDGARLNDPMTGHFLTDFPVPLAAIARIEVLRGPASALYGPDAIGGVVQVFTWAGLRDAGAAPGTAAGVQAGTAGAYRLDAAARRDRGRTFLSAATEWQGADGDPLHTPDGTPLRRGDDVLRADFRRSVHSLALSHTAGAVRLYGRAGLDDRAFGAYHFYTPFPSDTAREATTTYWAQLRLTGPRWQVQAAARRHEDTYVYNPQTPANRHTSTRYAVQARVTQPTGAGLRLTAGLEAALRAIDSNNLGRHRDGAAGVFATAGWQPRRRLSLRAGGRLDYDPGYGLEATPHLDAALLLGRLTLRVGVGRAVRAPNYVERYFNTTLARPRGRSLGNPDLRAEWAVAYEAGLDLDAGLHLHLTAFHRDTRNLIDYAKLTPADTVFLARNLLRVVTRGVELEADARATVGPLRLALAAGYTYLDAALHDRDPAAQYKYALTAARHLGQGTLSLARGPVRLGLQVLTRRRRDDAGYTVVNARLAYRLAPSLTLAATVRNAFDAHYAEVFDAPLPGRWWGLGLRLGP